MTYIILEMDKGKYPYEIVITQKPEEVLAAYDYTDVMGGDTKKIIIVCDVEGNCYDVMSDEVLPGINSKEFQYHRPWTPRLQRNSRRLSEDELREALLAYLLRLKSGLIFKKAKFQKDSLDTLSSKELVSLLENKA